MRSLMAATFNRRSEAR